MSDPTDPDTYDDPFALDAAGTGPGETDIEAPDGDLAEQRLEVRRAVDIPPTGEERGLETPEADTVDQHLAVELDEDDYRD